jgi:hypothetical protein
MTQQIIENSIQFSNSSSDHYFTTKKQHCQSIHVFVVSDASVTIENEEMQQSHKESTQSFASAGNDPSIISIEKSFSNKVFDRAPIRTLSSSSSSNAKINSRTTGTTFANDSTNDTHHPYDLVQYIFNDNEST